VLERPSNLHIRRLLRDVLVHNGSGRQFNVLLSRLRLYGVYPDCIAQCDLQYDIDYAECIALGAHSTNA
jgi:hypothetical protein